MVAVQPTVVEIDVTVASTAIRQIARNDRLAHVHQCKARTGKRFALCSCKHPYPTAAGLYMADLRSKMADSGLCCLSFCSQSKKPATATEAAPRERTLDVRCAMRDVRAVCVSSGTCARWHASWRVARGADLLSVPTHTHVSWANSPARTSTPPTPGGHFAARVRFPHPEVQQEGGKRRVRHQVGGAPPQPDIRDQPRGGGYTWRLQPGLCSSM